MNAAPTGSQILGILAFVSLLCGAPVQAKVYSALPGESVLSYHMVHKMHEFSGVSKKFRCAVDLPEDTLKARIYVKAAVVEFNSGNSSRDGNMLEVTEASKFPFVEFLSDSVRKGCMDENGRQQWRVFGRLSFHGVKKPVSFLVRPEIGGGKVRVRGAFDISLTDFKIERPSLLMIPVDDALQIRIDVVANEPQGP
jgi:polyisoprenoid-binding protein YceI